MNETVVCAVAADGDRIHRYVAGALGPGEVAEFETHLLGCTECQAAVREGAAVGAALQGSLGAQAPVRRWWTVPLVAAAAGVIWLIAGREDQLARLGRVITPPPFAGVPVRANVDSATALIDRGMAAYTAGRYAAALRAFAAVPAEDRSPGVRFYLGVAALLADDPREAIRGLNELPAASSYLAEAQFYLAKAWLRLGEPDSALAHLAAVPPDARIAGQAAALAGSVREVLRKRSHAARS